MKIDYKVYSTIGKRNENQDAYMVKRIGDFYMFAVADGIGGGAEGKEAANITINYLENLSRINSKFLYEIFKSLIKEINLNLRNFLNGYKGGTTLTIFLINLNDKKGFYFNIGDSRLSLVRNDILGSVTIDQNRFYRKLMKNEFPNEDDKRFLIYFLGKSFNLDELFENKLWGSFGYINIKDDDFFLLSTDGFHNLLDISIESKKFYNLKEEENIKSILKNAKDNATLITIYI